MVWSDISFQSTLSMRRATREACRPGMRCRFQSTLSMRRATALAILRTAHVTFQSTLSMRRATRATPPHINQPKGISIHALHEESDLVTARDALPCTDISIHALHEESDMGVSCSPAFSSFQSTLSMRRATSARTFLRRFCAFQSTLSMRRATKTPATTRLSTRFQSTLSMRRATRSGCRPSKTSNFNPRSP